MKITSEAGIPCAVFLVVLGAYVLSPVITSGDSRWSVPTAMSIIKEGNADLNEYPEALEASKFSGIEEVDARYYTIFPIGVSVIAVPFVFAIDVALRTVCSLFPAIEQRLIQQCSVPLDRITAATIYWRVELLVASFIGAIASVFIYLLARRSLDRRHALLVTFVFVFCTSMWSVASRALWSHGPSVMLLALALYLVVLAKEKPHVIQYVSLPLAFSYVVRPTNSIPIAAITVFVFARHRKLFVRYVLWSLVIAVPFLAYNFRVYHWFLPPYYRPGRLGESPHFLEALAGNLVSPARGLFVYSPIFLFSLFGVALKLKDRKMEPLDFFLLAVILLHWLVISSFGHWYGGDSYGPRFWTDMIPFLIYFLIPAVGLLPQLDKGRSRLMAGIMACAIAGSFFMHCRGATSLAVWEWNREPVAVADAPERLWDWSDPQFLRGL